MSVSEASKLRTQHHKAEGRGYDSCKPDEFRIGLTGVERERDSKCVHVYAYTH